MRGTLELMGKVLAVLDTLERRVHQVQDTAYRGWRKKARMNVIDEKRKHGTLG